MNKISIGIVKCYCIKCAIYVLKILNSTFMSARVSQVLRLNIDNCCSCNTKFENETLTMAKYLCAFSIMCMFCKSYVDS